VIITNMPQNATKTAPEIAAFTLHFSTSALTSGLAHMPPRATEQQRHGETQRRRERCIADRPSGRDLSPAGEDRQCRIDQREERDAEDEQALDRVYKQLEVQIAERKLHIVGPLQQQRDTEREQRSHEVAGVEQPIEQDRLGVRDDRGDTPTTPRSRAATVESTSAVALDFMIPFFLRALRVSA
jgi:hypothetical protein